MDTSIRNLMFDVAGKKTIYDAESDRVVTASEANDAIVKFCREKLGLTERSTARDITRALKRPEALELFEVIEEIADLEVATGWQDDEFFNEYVEQVNLKDGDANEFWTDDDIILTVTRVAGDHHDLDFDRVCVA